MGILNQTLYKGLNTIASNPGIATDFGTAAMNLDPAAEVAMLLSMVAVRPTYQAVRGWFNQRDDDKPTLDISPELATDTVKSIFEVLAAARNETATGVLDAELAGLMDEPDWKEVNRRLDDAAKKWCANRQEGAGNPLNEDELVQVLLILIRNVREATYRKRSADHYHKIDSVDRRDRSRVDDVYIRLKADRPDQEPSRQDGPEYLDFRSKTPTEIEETLRETGNLVILGEPGSGKSTLLRHLAASCAESGSADGLLPIFLPLRKYTDGQEVNISDSAVTFAEGELQLKMPDGFFDDALSSGRCLVCLDALDEVPEKERKRIVRSVEELAHDNPECRFIVTSRVAGYDEDPLDEQSGKGRFTRYIVQPMDDDGVSAFIDRLCAGHAERAQDLRGVLNANPGIKALASNPLLLAILDLVHREDDQRGLPLKTAGLYARAIEELLKDEDFKVDRDTRDSAFYRYRKHILVAVAGHLHGAGRETIGKNCLKRFVARFLVNGAGIKKVESLEGEPQAQAFVELAEQRTGLLVGEEGDKTTEFRFLHTTFREYLAAQHIYLKHYSDEPDALPDAVWDDIKEHLTDDHWREVVLFLLGGLEEDEEKLGTYLTEKILAAGDETMHQAHSWSLPTHLQLAADALANQAPMSPELQQGIVGRLENIGKDPRAFYGAGDRAVHALGAINHLLAMVTTALSTIAIDHAVHVWRRMNAARELVRLGARNTAIETLIDIANNPAVNADSPVDYMGGWGELLTGVLGDLTANNSVVGFEPGVDASNSWLAALELIRLGEGSTATKALIGIANDPAVRASDRMAAASTLGELGESAMATVVLTDIVDDPKTGVSSRVTAASTLGKLGESTKATEVLTAIINSPGASADSRVAAAEALEPLGDRTTAISCLTNIATDSAVADRNRVAAASALGELSQKDPAISTLERYVLTNIAKDTAVDPSTRINVAGDLGRLGESATAITVLTAVATDPAVRPRDGTSATQRLAELGAQGVAALTDIASDASVDAGVRVSAARILGNSGYHSTAKDILQTIINNRSLPPVHHWAARAALLWIDRE